MKMPFRRKDLFVVTRAITIAEAFDLNTAPARRRRCVAQHALRSGSVCSSVVNVGVRITLHSRAEQWAVLGEPADGMEILESIRR